MISLNKNKNSNNNKIHITINNKSTSRRKRKGKPKQGSSSVQPHYGNAMPTIIQMHQPQPTIAPTTSQVTDNRYGVGMTEKVDALSGGLTRVLENIENKQQEYYSREKNEAFLRKELKNRLEEHKALQKQSPPTSVAPLKLQLPPPTIADDIPPPTSVSSYEPSLQIPRAPPSSMASLEIPRAPPSSIASPTTPSDASSSYHGTLGGSKNTYGNLNFLDSYTTPKKGKETIIKTPQFNPDDENDTVSSVSIPSGQRLDFSNIYDTPNVKEEINPRAMWHKLRKKKMKKHLKDKQREMVYNSEYYQDQKAIKQLQKEYQEQMSFNELKNNVGDKILKGPISKTFIPFQGNLEGKLS